MSEYRRGDCVFILRPNGEVLASGKVQRQRPDGRYKVRKAGSNQVVTVPGGRLEGHPQSRWA
ncbi:hypothetical protein [Streptomyces syringium]|uniref:hypothetical protein n=1 Tax=Streptomyces syringium TaxID=76729 RepID=UPI0037D5CF3D